MDNYLTERYLRLPDGTLPHLGVTGQGDVAPFVILVGNPERLERIKPRLDSVELVGDKRGYVVWTGRYRGVPITLASSGLGAPSLAITVEELALTGAKVFLRVGSCASIQPEIPVGDLIIATGAVRDEGTSHNYAPGIYPAIAHPDVVAALRTSADREGARYHLGLIRSTDSFYEGERKQEIIDKWRLLRVAAFEMESSAMFTIASIWGCLAGSILVPGSNLITRQSTYQGNHTEPYKSGIETAITIALAAIGLLHAAT